MKTLALRFAGVIAAFFLPCLAHAADVTVKIDKYTKMGTSWKVEVSGTLKIETGETYSGLVGYFLNEDDQSKESVTWVSITAPKVGTDGSYSYWAVLPEGNWAATAIMKYIPVGGGKEKDFPAAKGFVLPPP